MTKKTDYNEILESLAGKNVIVSDGKGLPLKGLCRAINTRHLNVILQTKKELIVVKDAKTIRVQRSEFEDPNGDQDETD